MSYFSISINSSDPKVFVSGSCDATARLWDTRIASRAVRTYHDHAGDVNAVKFFPDGKRFGTGSDDGTCRLFDLRTGHQLQSYIQEPSDGGDAPPVTSIAFSVSGRLLFAAYSNGDCYVWDTLVAQVCCSSHSTDQGLYLLSIYILSVFVQTRNALDIHRDDLHIHSSSFFLLIQP